MTTGDTGNAGEHLVCARLLFEGFRVYFAPRGQSCFDLVAEWPETGRITRLRVKTGREGQIHWGAKGDGVLPELDPKRDDDFSVLVDARDIETPIFHVVPSAIVERTLVEGHAHYLKYPKRGGGPRKDSTRRRIIWDSADWPDTIARGFAVKWATFRGAFELLN